MDVRVPLRNRIRRMHVCIISRFIREAEKSQDLKEAGRDPEEQVSSSSLSPKR